MSKEQVQKLWYELHAKGAVCSWNAEADFKQDMGLLMRCDAIFLATGWQSCRYAKLMYKAASLAKMRIYNPNQLPIVR